MIISPGDVWNQTANLGAEKNKFNQLFFIRPIYEYNNYNSVIALVVAGNHQVLDGIIRCCIIRAINCHALHSRSNKTAEVAHRP